LFSFYCVHTNHTHRWAPASLQQATDRAHRRGAEHPVTEVLLMAQDSTDQFINEIIHAKKKGYAKKLNAIAASLRGVRIQAADTGMNMANVERMISWFQRHSRQRRAPRKLEDGWVSTK
jgi:hypothetical protein